MTNNDELHNCDNHNASETISQTKSPASEEISVDAVTTNNSSATAMAKPQPDDDLKDHKLNDNDIYNHNNEPETIPQTRGPAHEEISVDTEQPHSECATPFTEEEISSKEAQAKRQLDCNPGVMTDNFPTKSVTKFLSDADLMNIFEHCFGDFDFASISLHENSEESDHTGMNALKKVFSGDANDTYNDATKDSDNNNINNTSDRKYLKSHHLRKRRFLKHMIQENTFRMRLERMLQESAYIERFLLTKKKHSRKQQTLINAAATIPKTPRILCDDRSGVDENSERRCKGGGISDLDVGDEDDSKSDCSDGGNDIDNYSDDSNRAHLNKINNQEEEHNIHCASSNSSMGDQAFTNFTPKKNILISNQEGARLPPLEELIPEVHNKSNFECLVHMDNLKDRDEEHSDLRALNKNSAAVASYVNEKGDLTTGTLVVDEEGSESIPTRNLSSGVCNRRNYNDPIDLDETYNQEEFQTLLPSPQDQHRHNKIDSNRIANKMFRDMNESPERSHLVNSKQRTARASPTKKQTKASTTDVKEGRSKKYIDARKFRGSAVTNDQSIENKNNSGTNEESNPIKSASGSSSRAKPQTRNNNFLSNSRNGKRGTKPKFTKELKCFVGSSEADDLDYEASALIWGTIEKTGARSKATSVTSEMDNDSTRTCYSREVALGGPSSESSDSSDEEGSNLMESSISNIVKRRAKKNRSRCLHCVCTTTMVLFLIIGIFAIGLFLGFVSN
jgi:hypothetical protein